MESGETTERKDSVEPAKTTKKGKVSSTSNGRGPSKKEKGPKPPTSTPQIDGITDKKIPRSKALQEENVKKVKLKKKKSRESIIEKTEEKSDSKKQKRKSTATKELVTFD